MYTICISTIYIYFNLLYVYIQIKTIYKNFHYLLFNHNIIITLDDMFRSLVSPAACSVIT